MQINTLDRNNGTYIRLTNRSHFVHNVFNRLIALSYFALFSLISQTVLAQSVSELSTLLDTQIDKLSALQAEQFQLQTALQANSAELAPLLNEDLPGKEPMDNAQTLLMKAKIAYQQDSTPHNQSRLKNAEFKFALAERRFKKSNKHVFALKEENERLQQQIANNELSINALNTSVASYRTQLKSARSRQLAEQQALKAKEQQNSTAAAEQEIIRLKAELEKQKRLAAQKTRDQEKMLAAQKALEASRSELAEASVNKAPVEQSIPEEPKSLPATPAQDNTAQTAPVANRLNGKNGISLLLTAEEVANYEAMVKELVAQKTNRSSKKRRIMNIKPVISADNNNQRDNKTMRLKLIKNSIYRGKKNISAGDTVFILGNSRWRQTIPPIAADNSEFGFIFNNFDRKNPELVYFPQSLSSQAE